MVLMSQSLVVYTFPWKTHWSRQSLRTLLAVREGTTELGGSHLTSAKVAISQNWRGRHHSWRQFYDQELWPSKFSSYFNILSSGIDCTKTIHGISIKFYRSVHKTLNYHMKQILWQENKNIYFLLASEIYHCSILPKIERKSGKYFIRCENIYLQHFSIKMMYGLCM